MKTRYSIISLLLVLLIAMTAEAQIVIGGHVYGGGNAGDTDGNSTVTIRGGDLNRVFGGARMANVGGRAFMHVDGAHASSYIVINRLYGGNDIAGTIGTSTDALPEVIQSHATNNGVDKLWNALVLISTKTNSDGTEATDAQKIYIGQLFGGGDGEYVYGEKTVDANTVYFAKGAGVEVATSSTPLTAPNLGKTFVDIHGGSIVYAYGGGNNATVTDKTVISLDNPSKVVNHILVNANGEEADATGYDTYETTGSLTGYHDLLTNDRFENKMGINTTFSYPSSAEYQIGRLFGGNNKADMAIRPRWNLQKGRVRMLYGGGNEGRMTSPEGLLTQIEGAGMVVENVFGGCRKADVKPLYNNNDATPVPYNDVALDPEDNPNKIPAGYAARVRVLAGHVTNVYGGNDISGNVYGGNTVGIFTHIYGDVYGGGNGSYAYTDNPDLENDPHWGDLYYNPKKILGLTGDTFTGLQSAEALNLFRPNAEKVSILVRGTEDNPTIIDGALYVGGNSASLRPDAASSGSSSSGEYLTHIKIGSHVIIDNTFLGNNGANMIKTDEADASGHHEGVLRTMKSTDYTSDHSKFNSMDLTDKDVFAKYMEGCAMKVKSGVLFEDQDRGDPNKYIDYSSKFGSFYCGGNVGSMITDGKVSIDFSEKAIVYDKVVGGCNNANVYKSDFNAEYLGGLLGAYEGYNPNSDENQPIGDKLELNFSGLKIQPMRWKDKDDKSKGLVWNTISSATGEEVDFDPSTASTGESSAADMDRRLKGGNIYGGCYNTGHVNGNVVININSSIVDRKGEFAIFDQVQENEGEAILYGNDSYKITERRSGVILDEQGMDVLGKALNVFGGGYGGDSEIWGSTTINMNKGYVFQVFGGGENGPIGKADSYDSEQGLIYSYNPKYSCHVNLKGDYEGVYRGHANDNDDMAEAEFIYGGSFEAPIAGNTIINLGNGRIFNSFAGSCNADILGHTETYIGRSGVDANGNDILGFPWVRDHVYGGNDLGGRIRGTKSFTDRIDAAVKDKIHNPTNAENAEVATATAYMEYIQGRVDNIFGGCYGDYDYTDPHFKNYTYTRTPVKNEQGEITGYTYTNDGSNADNIGQSKPGFTKPRLDNAFVNFRPQTTYEKNAVTRIFGAGQGSLKGLGVDSMQNRSYVLVEIPHNNTLFQKMEVFGAGANCGLGMGIEPLLLVDHKDSQNNDVAGQPDKASAIIDLVRGQIKNVFGGSYEEGVTRRTMINVPKGSTIKLDSIFGGAFGADPMYPCDVYEAQVNYHSEDARVNRIFGGNNSADRTLYGQINIDVPVWQDKESGNLATVFGAGFGKDTWSQYTEVNLLGGAEVYEVYGGGNNGKVLNTQSLAQWRHDEGADLNISIPGYETSTAYTDKDDNEFHLDAGLESPLAHAVSLNGQKYNTNVHIHTDAIVHNYAYGGGLGADAVVSGTTYIDLLGGTVNKDLYAAGTSGAVLDYYKAKEGQGGKFTASSTAYIEGGTARNVYGGGWAGDVGYHNKEVTETTTDILGETYVVIGIRKDQATLPDGYGFYKGVPAIQRNAYSGGEGGSVFGTAHLTMNNGYIGYTYNTENGEYEEKLHDETWTDHVGKDRLSDCGNLFGGGYDDNSSVDFTDVTVWGGQIRNSVFGGGEIATIGRGKVKESDVDNKTRVLDNIYKYGGTNIKIYNGHIRRNVFAGGKGYNILGFGGIHGFYTDGYVFGQTQVYLHGGEIGTEAGVAEGYGNVFGGGDVGFVYGKGYLPTINSSSTPVATGSPGHVYYKDENGNLTEDCKVVVSPMLQIKKNGTSVTYEGKTYNPYDYVPTDYLNSLPADKTDSRWQNLYMGEKQSDDDMEERGVLIRNAVFAGGNVSSNSESYANSTTVYGNTTATLYDVYHHDFITVGTEHTGGLYGGGNLSLVGGYRELNITNYGTDYYGLDQQISLEEYRKLTNRERAYFKLEYLCQQNVTISGKDYKQGDRISEDEYEDLPADYKSETYWVQYGFCSIYAGRLLNTIQRADFCGVFGSRLVLQGAKDRVADVADATEYTINRIGELSLNQQRFTLGDDSQIHGNYFGIYSIVNYLGALTSDVSFDDPRRYIDKGQTYTDEKNYRNYKVEHLEKRDRNNGTSWNQVALASGVYLELTTELSTPKKKDYGYITGVVELDLINVKKDIEGGGYVYARNEHGAPSELIVHPVLLSDYNKKSGNEALSNKKFEYNENSIFNYQTSGNFIHKSKRIVDDCYPNNGIYDDGYVKSPAHYWYIKGEVYIYDQVVSAYAGSAAAYSKEVKIPLTITAGSNGKLKLLNVQPSLYAYYSNYEQTEKIGTDGVKVDNESMTYKLNDVISWWDWHQLAQNEQKYFVKETRVNVDSCTINGVPYSAGTYVLEDDKSIHTTTAWDTFKNAGSTVKDARGEVVTDLDNLFRSSNNISHETGYVLTLDMNSPKDWDKWYSPNLTTGGDKIDKATYGDKSAEDKDNYRQGPTYRLTGASGLYGQREYSVGEVISKETYDDYINTVGSMAQQPTGQAEVELAYVALEDFGNTQAGSAIGKTDYEALTDKSKFAPAMVCINSIQVGEEEYILMGELVSGKSKDISALAQKYKEYNNSKPNTDDVDDEEAMAYVMSNLSNAYYIKKEGLYGGQYYDATKNYSAIKSWSTLTDDRDKFDFNYDALDVLVDKDYHGEGYIDTYYKTPYSEVKSVEYNAYYNGTGTLTYYDNDNTQHTISSGNFIDREAYEKVRNDQLHYTRLSVDAGSDTQTFYIVNETLIDKGNPYAKGQDISEKDFNALTDVNKAKVATVNIQKGTQAAVKYYCYEDYTPANTFSTESGTAGKKGSIITNNVFINPQEVPNYQKEFSIQGSEPTETTTLYVSRESNAKDVTSEKVISVVYQYTYYEPDDEGEGVSLVNELHVINIHLQLESGAPEIGPLNVPPAVLPGTTLGMKAPSVNPGLYEVLTSGWELFASEDDAQLHRNGTPFTINGTPLYWYQNQKVFLAFYSKTYLGKTYSNYVPLTVANYHDLDAVMKDKEHHLYVDHPNVMRNSKIYIDNRDCESDTEKSELDLLKDFFDLSLQTEVATTGATKDHSILNSHVKGGADLEFILNSNVSPKKYTSWTPVGDANQCFEGNLHGDGYTVSGLNKSLFGKLCGSVYNLGVTGSFTSAGVVDTGDGYVENCWINTTGTPDGSVRAVFGDPSRGKGIQMVNCYYQEGKNYYTTNNGRGIATPMTDQEFYNGTVAYNLNGFYLNKRYYDHAALTSGTEYKYLKANADGTLPETPLTGYYAASHEPKYGYVGYVEERYKDGDFIYANGTIPEAYDERMRVVTGETTSETTYSPIWPDDYLYFGQMLTYGYSASQAHEDLPSHIAKSGGRLPVNNTNNRVYRAPAYYQSEVMDKVHYNLWAVLAAKSAPKTISDTDLKDAYPNMTAVDFAGHNDNTWSQGSTANAFFYSPLLDSDDGLLSIRNEGETPNLLVYAPSADVNAKTLEVLTDYFVDPVYTSYYTDDKYRKVAAASASSVHGHLVQSDLTATNDHLLVDKRDFFCPIAYSFNNTHLMWYQRMPDRYVDITKGWETVSLPFTAELVTTQDKGEITHFYSGSRTIEGSEAKIGHEYWLREYDGKSTKPEDADVFKAVFNYPEASGGKKSADNTFLWDYYYSKNGESGSAGPDANNDTYQTYYKVSRELLQYPLLAHGTPYIIGFPGTTYREFDLCGEWIAPNTAETAPAKLDKQVITFASNKGESISGSATEVGIDKNGYTFKPNYLSKEVKGYFMNTEGNSFDKAMSTTVPTTEIAVATVPFRPYFVASPANGAPRRAAVKSIVFDSSDSSFAIGDEPSDELAGELTFSTKPRKLVTTSSLRQPADVRIYNVSGVAISAFTIQPGETVETDITVAGVYIIRAANGRYTKKLALK